MMVQMSVMDWLVVGAACAAVLAVLVLLVLASELTARDVEMEIRNDSIDEHAQDVLGCDGDDAPFPDAIEHEGGRVCRGCDRRGGHDQ